MARTERLVREAAAQGVCASVPAEWTEGPTAQRYALLETVRGQLSECRGPNERAERALGILVEQSGAARGFLLTVDTLGLELVVSTGSHEAPASLAVEVQEALKPFIDADEVTRDVFGEDSTTALFESGRRKLLVLSAARDGRLMVVGAVILEAGDVPLNSPPPRSRMLLRRASTMRGTSR